MPRVPLLESPYTSADSVFAKYSVEVCHVSGALRNDELIEALNDVDMVGIRSKANPTREILDTNPHLIAIGAFCIGTDQVDVSVANEVSIVVFNTSYVNTRFVVELVIVEAITLAHYLMDRNSALQTGIWEEGASDAHEVRGKALGIAGYGSISTQLDIIAGALSMSVLSYDIAERLAAGNTVRMRSLSQLFERADIVPIHIDGYAPNTGPFGRDRVVTMKEGTVLINSSCDSVVDLEVVQERLTDGSFSGVGIDMLLREPNVNDDPLSCSLTGLDDIILALHVGGSTIRTQESIGSFVAKKFVSYQREGLAGLSVNMPRVDASPTPSARHCVTWIHSNTPGALVHVNSIFAAARADIDAQTLVTSGEVGYMVTDPISELPELVLTELSKLDQSIRLQVLRRD